MSERERERWREPKTFRFSAEESKHPATSAVSKDLGEIALIACMGFRNVCCFPSITSEMYVRMMGVYLKALSEELNPCVQSECPRLYLTMSLLLSFFLWALAAGLFVWRASKNLLPPPSRLLLGVFSWSVLLHSLQRGELSSISTPLSTISFALSALLFLAGQFFRLSEWIHAYTHARGDHFLSPTHPTLVCLRVRAHRAEGPSHLLSGVFLGDPKTPLPKQLPISEILRCPPQLSFPESDRDRHGSLDWSCGSLPLGRCRELLGNSMIRMIASMRMVTPSC